MDIQNEEWQRKGATLSDKTARQEFGLTQDEISTSTAGSSASQAGDFLS